MKAGLFHLTGSEIQMGRRRLFSLAMSMYAATMKVDTVGCLELLAFRVVKPMSSVILRNTFPIATTGLAPKQLGRLPISDAKVRLTISNSIDCASL